MKLPKSHEQYTDVYFLRAKKILEEENLNPFVRAQLFIRKGPGKIYGIQKALQIIDAFSGLRSHGGTVYALEEGSHYDPGETIMLLEGHIQDIISLETILLGVISSQTTQKNDHTAINLSQITKNMRDIAQLVGTRNVMYFGARHWDWAQDALISKAAFEGGASDASTDIGAGTVGKKGVGTIPHSLQCVFAWKYGQNQAVIASTEAFDRWIDPRVPRIALVDFANKEIDDALVVAKCLGNKLYGVRVDTCGENVMQGAEQMKDVQPEWTGKGVSVAGVYALRHALDINGFQNVKIILSSGFGDIQKVKTFIDAEKKLKIRLFDSLGVGELFPVRSATMDIVGVGQDIHDLKFVSKVGRVYKANKRLKKVLR